MKKIAVFIFILLEFALYFVYFMPRLFSNGLIFNNLSLETGCGGSSPNIGHGEAICALSYLPPSWFPIQSFTVFVGFLIGLFIVLFMGFIVLELKLINKFNNKK